MKYSVPIKYTEPSVYPKTEPNFWLDFGFENRPKPTKTEQNRTEVFSLKPNRLLFLHNFNNSVFKSSSLKMCCCTDPSAGKLKKNEHKLKKDH